MEYGTGWRSCHFNGEQSWTYSVDGETLAVIDYPREDGSRPATFWDKGQMMARCSISFCKAWTITEVKQVVFAAVQVMA